MTAPPPDRRSLRGWLATVLRRTAAKDHRSTERRARREVAAARPEGTPSTADVVAQVDLHARVVRAVLALDEPWRTAVLLRFFEDLPPREIATRTNVPVETVRSRVRRGVELLRERFDRDHGGDRKAWATALLPLVGDTEASPAQPAPAESLSAGPSVAFLAGGLAAIVLAVVGVVHLMSRTTDGD